VRGRVILGVDPSIAPIVKPGLAIFFEPEPDALPYEILSAEKHGHGLLIALSKVVDKTTADALAKREVFVERDALPPAGPGEYYDFDVIGASVETRDGRNLGRIVEIIVTGANDVYVAQGPEGEILIPAIDAAIENLDPTEGRLVVNEDALEFSAKKDTQ